MALGNIGNIEQVEADLSSLENTISAKRTSLRELRLWLNGFSKTKPVTQAQIDEKLAELNMGDIQTKLTKAKNTFTSTTVIEVDTGVI